MKPKRNLLLAASIIFAVSPIAFAADVTWDITPGIVGVGNGTITGGAGTWDTTNGNWTKDAGANNIAWDNANNDKAIFGGTGGTVTLGGAITANGLQFDVSGYTVTGDTITLAGTTPGVNVATGVTATLDSQLAGTAGFTKTGTGTLTLNRATVLGYTGATNVSAGVLIVNTTGSYLNDVIADNSAITVGSGAELRFTGSGPNPFVRDGSSAAVTLNGGTFDYQGNTHGHMGNIFLNDGATWKASSGGGYSGENMQLNGNVTVGGTSASTIGTFNQGIGLNGTREFSVADVTGNSNVDLTVSAELEDNDTAGDGINKTGAGTMNITTGASYTGGTIINGGTLRLSSTLRNSSGITVNTGATLETNAVNIFVGGHGSAVNASRVVTLNNGTWVMTSSHDARIGNVTLNNGSTWTSNRPTTNYDALLGNTTAGAATVAVTGTGASVMNGTGGLHLQGVQNFDVADTTGSTAADLTVSMELAGPGSAGGAVGGINKLGAGTMAISKQTTYTGGTTVNNGVLDLTGGGGSDGTIRGTATVNTGATLRLSTGDATGYGTGAGRLSTINLTGGTMHINTTSNQTLGSATINMTGGSITGIAGSNLDLFANGSAINTLASATTSTISGTSLGLRQDDSTFTVADGGAAVDLSISSNLTDGVDGAGNNALIKAGAGVMEISGTNTYTGNTTVNGGSLVVSGNSSLATGSVSVTAGSLYVTGQLGGDVSVSSGAIIGGDGTIGAISFDGGAMLDISALAAIMTTGGISFSSTGFGIDNLIQNGAAIDWTTIADGTYDLLSGALNSTNLGNFGASNAYDIDGISGDRTAYFESGSLKLVVVPEPSAALLGGLGALFLLRRRRNG